MTIDVAPINVAPVIVTNAGLILAAGSQEVITSSMLHVTDVDNSAQELTFTLVSATSYGTLTRDGVGLEVGSSFTQADIDAGFLSYIHAGNANLNDAFVFTVSDGAGGLIDDTTFQVGINAEPLTINLNGTTIDGVVASYSSGQDLTPAAFSIEDDGATLRLQGNTWKRIGIDYVVTENTLLEFDFQSNQEGEIQAIGLDDNNSASSTDFVFQLFGNQEWWVQQDFHNYEAADGWKHYVIPVGEFFTGNVTELVLVNDNDALAAVESLFSDIRIYESKLSVNLDGTTTASAVDSYSSGQDLTPATYVIEDDGATLRLQGNTWKRVGIDYVVTENTVLEFDFQSNREGEIQAIGLDNNIWASSTDFVFQLYGTQQWWVQQDFHNYEASNGWKHYVIPVGEYFTGNVTELVLVNDNDALAAVESLFSDIRIYEKRLNVNLNGTTTSSDVHSYSSGQDLTPAAYSIEDDGATLRLQGNTWKRVGIDYVVTENTVLEFDFQSGQEGEIQAIGLDDNIWASSTDFVFQLYGSQTWWVHQEFKDYEASDGWKHYVIPVGEFFTGTVTDVVMINDNDALAPVESLFSNILLYEAEVTNTAPTITSAPETSATEDSPYTYAVTATDPDVGDTLTFSLPFAPAGMTIDANTGLVQWTPSNDNVGANAVTVRVTDAVGTFDTQSFSVTVESAVSGLVGHWKFDDDDGNNQADDSSGNGNHGTIQGATFLNGTALDFDGVDDHVDLGRLDVNGTGLTIAAWINADSFVGAIRDGRIVSKATGEQAQDHYWMLSTNAVAAETRLRFRLKTAGYTDTLIASSGNLSTGQQYHVAAVYDGSTMRLYLDGVQVGSLAKTGAVDVNAAVSAWIGQNPNNYGPFDGLMDDVRIYDRGLSQQEIQDLLADNAPPTAMDDSYSVAKDSTLTVNVAVGVLANDSDPDGDAVAAVLVAGPSQGSLTLNADGSFSYTPDTEFTGDDSFTYKANDGTVDSGVATVSIVVTAGTNNVPTITSSAVTTATEDSPYTYDVEATDPDAGDTLTFSLTTSPVGMTINGSTGLIAWTPGNDDVGPNAVTVRVSDAAGAFDTQSFSLQVSNTNDAPTATDDSYSVGENSTLNVAVPGVLGNDSDVDGDALAALLVTTPGHGVLTLQADGSFTYTPDTDYTGSDSFTYKTNDGLADSNLATVNITVQASQPDIPGLALWESQMEEWGRIHGERFLDGTYSFGEVYYDSQRVFYNIADYTGDASWLAYAERAGELYRDDAVLPNNGALTGYWNFTHGLTEDYLRNGDDQSKNAAVLLSQNAAYAHDLTKLSSTDTADYSREVAYAIMSYINAERLGEARRDRLPQLFEQSLDHLTQWFVEDYEGADGFKPFMCGLVAEALIMYWEYVSEDPRIVSQLELAADWMWANAWIPGSSAFYYRSTDSTNPSPDLNLMIAPVYSWLYRQTGNTTYRDRGDQIFAGGVENAWLSGSKQFNQNYRWSFDYLKWRSQA